MEPTSFAAGLVGPAGLFISRLDAVERAQSYRSFASDNGSLCVQFSAAKVRLENWGRAVGFHEEKAPDRHHLVLGDEKTRKTVDEVFDLVRDIYDPSDARQSQSLHAKTRVTSAGRVEKTQTYLRHGEEIETHRIGRPVKGAGASLV